MSQLSLDDSDCIMEEPNITCIVLDDTQCENEDVPPPPPSNALEPNFEEGEVLETGCGNIQKETVCEIKFPNKVQYELFGSLIITSIKDKLKNESAVVEVAIENENEECVTLIVQKCNNFIEEIPLPAMPKVKTEEKAENFCKENSPDLTGIRELFTIDTTPVPKLDSVTVPSYKRAIKIALLDEEATALKKQKEEANVFKIKKITTCFNCGKTGHSIRECPKPHNAKRIQSAKRSCVKVERYHVDVEQRFAHMKPGCISHKLREALGLRKGELPFFFYRMRVLGYPPGWLEDAKVEHSGMNLFNSDGNKILHSDEDEGEIDAINHKYNISKIFDFPGFNKDPGGNFFDDYKYHNVPPFDNRQSKEEFIKTLGDNILTGYKRKKLKDFPNATLESNINETVHETADMEIEDPETTTLGEVQFTRPPPPSDQPPSSPSPPLPPPSSPPSSCDSPIIVKENGERDLSTKSPSLMELERQKQRLLQELQSNTIIEIEDSLIDEIIELDEADEKPKEKCFNTEKILTNPSTPTTTTNNEKAEDKDIVIKESFMGTPVLKFTSYNNLPNGENFKVGVSDVINFENLPDSTGKYEQMKEVIKKVRNCIHKLHGEE